MSKNTFFKRFNSKFSANLITLFVNLIINLFVPRYLGASAYGSFNFLTIFFQQFVNFFNLWITPAYYVKLSQRPREFTLIIFTFYCFSISITLIFTFILILSFNNNLLFNLLQGQEIFYVLLAVIFVV